QLYSHGSDGWELAINSIDAISETLVIPLSIKVKGSSLMSIDLTETEGEFAGQTIILHDLLTNIQHKLSDVPTYSFMANEDDNPDRFLLKFAPVGVNELSGSAMLHAYMQHNLLYILNPDSPTAHVELYNIRGHLVLCEEIGQGLQSIPVNVATGAYVVMMRTEKAVATRKLFVR
ncbi:MAG: T9SS type A sorting domain-containing protein, partial [Candidatus Electryoneaceae bacterium]|nr:T9SS type A sorting domain-containing protein [Candidatus Electryoneaceae bacterium]